MSEEAKQEDYTLVDNKGEEKPVVGIDEKIEATVIHICKLKRSSTCDNLKKMSIIGVRKALNLAIVLLQNMIERLDVIEAKDKKE
jgi:hypothetical protein